VERKACQIHEKGFDLAGKWVFCVRKGRRNQHTVILQHPFDLSQWFFWLRHNVQCVWYDYHIEWFARVWQRKHILHGKTQLRRVIPPFGLCNHFRRGIRRLDVCRCFYDVLGDQSRSGSHLQHCFVFHDRTDQLIHFLVYCPVFSHKAVIQTCISVPEILVFSHCCLSFCG